MKKSGLILLFLLTYFGLNAQREQFPTYFGIQVRPILPSNFGGSKVLEMSGENYNFKLHQTVGYSFGGTIRKGITKLIAFESGLNYTQRNFSYEMSLTDTSVLASDKTSFINYEIPINGLVYIQLSKSTYMNASMGVTAQFSPTDIKKITVTGGSHQFVNYGFYRSKIGANLNANLGFEYRTTSKGFFYFGGSISVPLKPLIVFESIHTVLKQTNTTQLVGNINGNYLSFDIKYFFPLIRKKGDQPIKSLID
jgi:hypothetical protein